GALSRAARQFSSADGRPVLFDAGLTAGDPGSNAALHQVPAIRGAVAAVARDTGASAYGVAGVAPATYDVSQASNRDLLHIFPVAIIVIAILLAIVLRSLIAPLYLIASVVISYLAAFGVSVLLFQDAAGTGGLNYFIPFLMFVFLLALGEDYNILVMTRIREEAGRMPLRQAVTRALEHTGSTVTSAGLVLAGTFGVSRWWWGDSPGAASTRASSPVSRLASSWTPSSSAPCSSPQRSRSSAAGTGGRPGMADPPMPSQTCTPPQPASAKDTTHGPRVHHRGGIIGHRVVPGPARSRLSFRLLRGGLGCWRQLALQQ